MKDEGWRFTAASDFQPFSLSACELLARERLRRILGILSLPSEFEWIEQEAPVAQLDRALASEAKGCGFDPRRVQSHQMLGKPYK